MIHHSMGTCESTSCPTYWMRSCLTPMTSNSNRPFCITWGPLHLAHIADWACGCRELTHCVNTSKQYLVIWVYIISLVPHIWHLVSLITWPVVPSMLIINIGKCNIFHKPDEAMIPVMLKACLYLKIILLFRTLKTSKCYGNCIYI